MKQLLILTLILIPFISLSQTDTLKVKMVPKSSFPKSPTVPPPPPKSSVMFEEDELSRTKKLYYTEVFVNAIFLNDTEILKRDKKVNESMVDSLISFTEEKIKPEIDFTKGKKSRIGYNGAKTDSLTGQLILTDLEYYRQYHDENGYENYRFTFFYKKDDSSSYFHKVVIMNRQDRSFNKEFIIRE